MRQRAKVWGLDAAMLFCAKICKVPYSQCTTTSNVVAIKLSSLQTVIAKKKLHYGTKAKAFNTDIHQNNKHCDWRKKRVFLCSVFLVLIFVSRFFCTLFISFRAFFFSIPFSIWLFFTLFLHISFSFFVCVLRAIEMSLNEHALPYVVLLLFASAPGSRLCIISYMCKYLSRKGRARSEAMAVDILTQNYEMVNLFIVHIKVSMNSSRQMVSPANEETEFG